MSHGRSLLLSQSDCQAVDVYCRIFAVAGNIGLCQQAAGFLEIAITACNPAIVVGSGGASLAVCVAALAVLAECSGLLSPTPSPLNLCDLLQSELQ